MSEYFGLKEDGYLISAPGENKFILKYQEKWAQTMSNTYFQSENIDIGHKLRPRLVYWGYLSNVKDSELVLDDLNDIAQIAVCIELIHKSSILLDDFIDKDTSRHSKPTFYIEHGIERTVIYALNLLCSSLELVNKTLSKRNHDGSFYYRSMNEIVSRLQEMTLGVLMELDLDKATMMDTTRIKKIMNLETSSLIINSLMMGYYLTCNENLKLEEILKNCGQRIGYVFQILNDMESFFSNSLNEHKGSINNDINRSRKNICVPILFALMSNKDKKRIRNAYGTFDEKELIEMMNKYNVKGILSNEINDVIDVVKKDLVAEKNAFQNVEWPKLFMEFLDSVINVFFNRISIR